MPLYCSFLISDANHRHIHWMLRNHAEVSDYDEVLSDVSTERLVLTLFQSAGRLTCNFVNYLPSC
jgi:hypothetical protein